MRIFALSDLHVDFEENWAWVQALSPVDYQRDVLIVAGDITHQIERALQTFHVLRKRFLRVFFVPGNHDLWVRGERGDSLKKMDTLRSACEECGIDITPAEVHGVRLVPLSHGTAVSLIRDAKIIKYRLLGETIATVNGQKR